MKKIGFRLKSHINTEIKVGDTVQILDGSGLITRNKKEKLNIAYNYPELTGSEEPLEKLVLKVAQTGISHKIAINTSGTAYVQDVIIETGGTQFRTCSNFLRKVTVTPTYHIGQRFRLEGRFSIEEYMLSQVDFGKVSMIALSDGNRRLNPITVENVKKITQEELIKTVGSGCKSLKLINKTGDYEISIK